MTRTITARPVTVRAQSVADLPDPDLIADIVDAAVAQDPGRARAMLEADELAEVDVWFTGSGWVVWIGERVLARSGDAEAA